MKKLLLLGLMLLGLGGVISANVNTPIKLTGGGTGQGDGWKNLEASGCTVTPINGSTMDNLYAATFAPGAGFTRIFQYQGMSTADYDQIVIKFGEPVKGDWRVNLPNGKFPAITGVSEYRIDLTSVDTYEDFTIFNWDTERNPITITECYFVKFENELVHSKDYSSESSYSLWNQKPDGATIEINETDHVLEVVNSTKVDNWTFQYFVDENITTIADEDYIVSIKLKSTVKGDITCSFGNWDYSTTQNLTIADDDLDKWLTKEATFKTFPLGANNVRVMLQTGAMAGTIQIEKVEVYRVPERTPIVKPTRNATDAKTDVFAGFKTIGDNATWNADTRKFTDVCGWQWDGDGIDLSQYRYLVITAGNNRNTDGAGLPGDAGWVSIKDNNNVEVKRDEYGADFMNMWFSQWNNHNCLCIDLEKLRKEKFFDIYHIKELKINGNTGFILGNVYASNQKPNNNKNWGGEDNGDYKIENLPKDKFGTICLPWQAAVAGAYVYEITGKFASGISLSQYNGLLEAGKPYIYKSNEGLNGAATNNVYFYKATAATVAEPIENNGLIGTFGNPSETEYVPVGDDNYVIGRAADDTEDKLYQVDQTVTLGANRAYINMAAITNKPANSRTLFVSFDGAEENDPTAIESTEAVEVLTEGVFYDMSGREVKNPTTGIYIVKYGNVTKKVMIK